MIKAIRNDAICNLFDITIIQKIGAVDMADYARLDLRNWRNEKGVSPVELARVIHKDDSAIYRYERGEGSMSPDDLYLICERLGDLNRWCDLMRAEYPNSYGKVHPHTSVQDLPGAIMSMYAEFEDVMDKQRETLRDGADGAIHDPALKEFLIKNVSEAIAAAQRFLNMLKS